MNRALSTFFSVSFAAALFAVFALSCAAATIIEAVYNIDAAWEWVYGANWFGGIQLLLGINLGFNIYMYKLYRLKKLPLFLFHLSFLFILLGAAMTRYFGFEGALHIRENDASNEVSTSRIYVQFKSDETSEYISPYISEDGKNDFNINIEADGKKASLKYKDFIVNGALRWAESKDGEPIVEIVFSDDENRQSIALKNGESLEAGDMSFTFNSEPKQSRFVKISLKEDKFYILTNQQIDYTNIKDMSQGVLEVNQETPLDLTKIYTFEGVNFAPSVLLASAAQKIVSLPEREMGNNAIIADLTYNNESREVYMLFGGEERDITVGGKEFGISWAPKIVKLPFSIYLKDFEMQRYPGSQSPSSYASDVTVIDGDRRMDYKIYMNHVLDYQGYRFFQSSYDDDEEGSILSVNKDPGKLPTYIGYFLLCVGMFFNFFNPNSRFLKLSRLLEQESAECGKKTKYGTCAAAFLAIFLFFGTYEANAAVPNIDANHAEKLSSLVVQGFDGRMKPFDTSAREFMSKIYGYENYDGLNAVQTMLSMMINSEYWREAAVIKVADDKLKDILGLSKSASHAKFSDFYAKDENNKTFYKLTEYSEIANRRAPNIRSRFDKEILKADERVNIFYMVFIGEAFKIVPKENDPNRSWYSPVYAMTYFPSDEAKIASAYLEGYFANVIRAQESGDWEAADNGLKEFKDFQAKLSKEIMPSQKRVEYEILFNKLKIFEKLSPIYLISGILLLIFVIIYIMKPNSKIKIFFKVFYAINILAFCAHTLGLALRWYISGHAPWSNTYESLVYIAWALSLSGIIFSRRQTLSLALTSILAGVTLFTAHLSIADPQITNIQPVLDSYWLTIHVSVITASYGFLGLCSLLGAFTLMLFILYKPNKNNMILKNIIEATRVNEMAMILGLCLLTVGNFLGGVWANESWGRYWGWDAKETWSLITILFYASIVHFRFIPRLNNQYWFALFSMFAYASVIMTYFGVNFYLSGMHSYASGEQIPIPLGVWISALLMFALAVTAFFKRKYSSKL
ncbi:MAG: cytochrome c biogenesis protein CcsA [Campylobacteraceae bacterium]|jgi:cytochrome c-type biogenesis protein CcsB|nr:cytochrome c biogenesis protein CcsA [Campylobacteraceae bacterium]